MSSVDDKSAEVAFETRVAARNAADEIRADRCMEQLSRFATKHTEHRREASSLCSIGVLGSFD